MKSFAATVIIAFSTNAFSDDPEMYRDISDHQPPVGVSKTVYLGDRMLEQREGQYKECIVPKFSLDKTVNMGAARFVIRANQPLCKSSPAAKTYTPNYPTWVTDPAYTAATDVKLKKKGDLYSICTIGTPFGGCGDWKPKTDFDSGPWFVYRENTFQQTIEYLGKEGDLLRFMYAEFADGFARQAFNREFQTDLSEGNVVAYKGAVIEIESATNASISYKVVRSFQQ